MERRVLLAILLAFLTLYVWQALFVRPQPKPTPGAASQAQNEPGITVPLAAAPANAPEAASVANAAAPVVGEAAEREIRVETADVIAVFTNRGGRLKSWRLKRYVDKQGQPVELVVTNAGSQPLPFSLRVDDAALTSTLNSALYTAKEIPNADLLGSGTTSVTFEYRDTAGLHVLKEFDVAPRSYLVSYRGDLTMGDRALRSTIDWGPGLGDPDSTTGRYAVKPGGLLAVSGKVQRLAAAAVTKQPNYDDDFEYAGIEDHYFLSVAVEPGASKVTFRALSIPPRPGSGESAARDLMAYGIDPGQRTQPLKFYVGPKDFDQLAAVNRDLVRAVNFGIWAVIIVPLLRALDWIYGYVGNYGWSIIILTIAINSIMFPLRHKSVVSMRRMQEIQPEAKAIQDRYAKLKTTDPARQKMNQELMALYKERGVNPASGCIPMLLTLPVLYAFYSLLTTAIELRGAPFTLWIHDLSLPDPYYVTPILMGASQLWQQWIAPATGVDPAQRKMMMVTPLVFTFLFVAAPSGTVLYWLMSNLWAIGQQYLTNYLIGPPKVRNLRPAAERQLKRVGGGKTEAAAREN